MKTFSYGINLFQNSSNNLNGCCNDSRDMRALVFSHFFKDREMGHLEDYAATKRDIWAALSSLQERAIIDKLPLVMISGSGHGITYPDRSEADGLGEGIACTDTRVAGKDWNPDTFISDKDLHKLLCGFPSTTIVEVWLDTCFSGGMDRAMIPGDSHRFMPLPGKKLMPVFPNSRVTVGLPANVIMWTAASENQTAADALLAHEYHGAFTYFWVKAFKENPKSSRLELLLKTRELLAKAGYQQWPRLKCWEKAAQRKVGR